MFSARLLLDAGFPSFNHPVPELEPSWLLDSPYSTAVQNHCEFRGMSSRDPGEAKRSRLGRRNLTPQKHPFHLNAVLSEVTGLSKHAERVGPPLSYSQPLGVGQDWTSFPGEQGESVCVCM